jgi:protein-S-isoprenylcysteine O-methyltransferase Ste14
VAVPADPKTARERGADVRFPPPLVFLIAVLAGVALRYAGVPLRAPVSRPLGLSAGLLVIAFGVAIVAPARIMMLRTKQSPIPWKPTPELILQGPYRFTRNPMYVGVTLIQVGVGLAFDNLWISLLAIPALAVVHFIAVLPEERYLTSKFGEPYRSYLTRVRRYL